MVYFTYWIITACVMFFVFLIAALIPWLTQFIYDNISKEVALAWAAIWFVATLVVSVILYKIDLFL